jgi:TRAP-type C4-dicarboxylate transport system substrate-binding protein
MSTLLVAACGGGSSDKAGGSSPRKTVVLTMANTNGGSVELDPFAAAVARISGGTLRIDFKNDWRAGTISNETGVIGDIKAGKADLAWAGSRAFDSVGVASFDALHAPLLIDSYPLEGKVLESPLVGSMLAGLKPLDVVGLGILPGPMRKPLGVSRLVLPADYRGKTLAYSRSRVAEETLRALGARGKEIPSAGSIAGYSGVEQQVAAIEGNSYDSAAKFLTVNVNLWPRPQVLFMNQKAFNSLSEQQRNALSSAAKAALPATLALEQNDQKSATANLCRRGLKFVTASDADIAALRRAVQPVYSRLERDAQTKAAIEQVRAMRQQSAATATTDEPTCAGAGSHTLAAGQATPIDGTYRLHTTANDLRAVGTPEADIIPANYGDFETVLNRGRFRQAQPLGEWVAGTYAVSGSTITLTDTQSSGGPASNRPGEVFTYKWSLYRDQLTLRAVPGKVSPEPLRAKPWRRVGNAP